LSFAWTFFPETFITFFIGGKMASDKITAYSIITLSGGEKGATKNCTKAKQPRKGGVFKSHMASIVLAICY
jgi:hypothetical protein